MAQVTKRLFTLAEITHASGPAYAEAIRQATPERAMRLFTERLVDALKALADTPVRQNMSAVEYYPPDEDPPHIYHSNPPRLPQKSD